MNIQSFIFNWRGHGHLTQQKYEIIPNATIINSDENFKCDACVNLGESAYFTAQFLEAIRLFNGDILFHVQADATYDRWIEFINDALLDYNEYKWGIYAPHISWTAWISKRVNISSLPNNRKIVKNTDCTAWMIHKDIVNYFRSLNIDISDNKYGWGIDLIFMSIAQNLQLPVIRNYNHLVSHPKHTNYNYKEARRIAIEMINKFPPTIRNSEAILKFVG